MKTKKENICAQMPVSSQQRVFRKNTSYLAKIAVVLQGSPGKMLTFTQLMDRLVPLISEERRSVENNFRVCLSHNSCFVKVPVVPGLLDSKKNYWKLDLSQITAKMVRRHFKGILHLFPELTSKLKNTSGEPERCSAPLSPEGAACRAVQIRCEVKFSGPFSIESLLKRESPSARTSSGSPLCNTPIREERVGTKRSLSWTSEQLCFQQTLTGSSPVCSTGGSTHHGLTKPTRRPHVYSEPSFSFYTRDPPYYNNPHSSLITYSVPAFTHDALRF